MSSRNFLLLQGVSSPFFAELGKGLRSAGHSVTKLNFNVGDALYWRGGSSNSYRQKAEGLAEYFSSLIEEKNSISDIVLFGDCRPVHKAIRDIARERGRRIHVFEEGYFRPYWVTLEREGVNGASLLPRDPEFYSSVGPSLPSYANGQAFDSSFFIRAWHDVAYHSLCMWNPVLYPGYRTHAPYTAATEYIGYMRRAPLVWWHGSRDACTLTKLIESRKSFYFFPMQLDSDAQIREYSRFSGMKEALEHVIESFALHAPGDTVLLIKNHPLDPGWTPYRRILRFLKKKFDLNNRVVFLETGHLPTILDHTKGVVTVNSTVGGSALVHGVPTKALANPIYNLAGLTFQGALDDFWMHGNKPRQSLLKYFRNTVINATQVNGGFYSRSGIKMAVQNSLSSLTSELSPLERLLKNYG